MRTLNALLLGASLFCLISQSLAQDTQQPRSKRQRAPRPRVNPQDKVQDAKHTVLEVDPAQLSQEDFSQFGIYENTAPLPAKAEPSQTSLPLQLKPGQRIALIGNTLFDRSQQFGHFEAFLQQSHPEHQLSIRHLAWSADAIDEQPRPANFANTQQHLTHEKIDLIFAAFGFNESFAGSGGVDAFRGQLTDYLQQLRTSAFDGQSSAKIVLVSPIANENIPDVPAADLNNQRLEIYVAAMREVAAEQQVGFVDVFQATKRAMQDPHTALTINGVHLNAAGDRLLAELLFRATVGQEPPPVAEPLLAAIADKNRQYFRRFRPLNTFYYTGGRNRPYGYLDFLPAMRNFDIMVANRERWIWDWVQGKAPSPELDDSNVPELPASLEQRGANEWLSAAEEQKAFRVDPRFEVNLFAGEEEFPDIAAPIQMRWDSRGRLWVSCSTTYPHVYPGQEPADKLVILEDTDGDGRADKSTVFADDLHIPLSFEFGNGGVYVSQMPHLTFLKDTDGDDRADESTQLLTGFGTEDSHHALHDITWTPDGDLIFRESVFHHSQVETAYGPVRQQNSGWFRFAPHSQRLLSFGTYSSTNPWGVTFDDWGQHVASHPVYAAAFHALDPAYPAQHPRPTGLQAYSGVCGHEFVDCATFPEELQGGFIKVRYKPTNRVEIHRWHEREFGFEEEYVGDLLFSTNLSFIPVDLQFGPRGDLFVCDWYNPVKGHMQYSLRDERRDRHSGRIWRITTKGKPTHEPPNFAEASIGQLLEWLKRPEYRVRYWSKRELRERDEHLVRKELTKWVADLSPSDARYRHHQLEALWTYRWLGDADLAHIALPEVLRRAAEPQSSAPANEVANGLLRGLLACDEPSARAAATQQLRYWYPELPDAIELLRASANDSSGIVRMEAAIAATYMGTHDAFEAMLDVLKHPRGSHLEYAIACALGSHTLRPFWEEHPEYGIAAVLKQMQSNAEIKEPPPAAADAQFDTQADLKRIEISCVPERMLFTLTHFTASPGQPLKIVFTNPDATDHNLVIVRPDALAEVGMAANEMARDPRNANSDFIPREKTDLILHASPMIGPTRSSRISVMRFTAPTESGVYPFVCTFPGHWVIMNGVMVIAEDEQQAELLLAESQPAIVREWRMLDFNDVLPSSDADAPHAHEAVAHAPVVHDEETVMRGMQAFVRARCNQCHVVAGHGVNLGPDLAESVKKLRGAELLRQIIEPSSAIHEKFKTQRFLTADGQLITGVVLREDDDRFEVATNLLTPNTFTVVFKRDIDERSETSFSAMPEGLVNVLTREEILDMLAFLESGGYELPEHLNHQHAPHD